MAGGSACAWFRTPFVCAVPFAICWEGTKGACSAEMADDAVVPEVAEFTVCGRAVEMPVAGSALPGGHRPRAGFLRAAQLPASEFAVGVPFVCAGDAEIVELEEAVEVVVAMEEEEFWRCAVFRGPGLNILLTSSEFFAPKPLPLEAHPIRLLG